MQENLVNDPNFGHRRWLVAVAVELDFETGAWDAAEREADVWFAESAAGGTHILETLVRAFHSLLLVARGDGEAALREAELAVSPSPREGMASQVEAHVSLAYLELGRPDEAGVLLEQVLALGEAMPKVLNDSAIVSAAVVASDLGRADEYRRLLEPAPETPWVRSGLAICRGELAEAAAVLARIGYRPGEALVRLRLAGRLVEAGRRAEADLELQRSLAFWREVGATRYVREGEALLAASA